jgi:hypothetical protein
MTAAVNAPAVHNAADNMRWEIDMLVPSFWLCQNSESKDHLVPDVILGFSVTSMKCEAMR